MRLMEAKETRNKSVLYEFYPQSLKLLFAVKYKEKGILIRAIFLFLASKGILFQYKIFDFRNKRKIKKYYASR